MGDVDVARNSSCGHCLLRMAWCQLLFLKACHNLMLFDKLIATMPQHVSRPARRNEACLRDGRVTGCPENWSEWIIF
jgi:hypothetical protein